MKRSLGSCSMLLVILVAGCASVPKDAPREIKQAQSELDRSDELDTEDHFPATIANAQKELDDSVDAFNKSKEGGADSAAQWKSALELANDSRSLSAGANELTTNMKDWDNNIRDLRGNYSIKSLVSQVNDLTSQVEKEKQALTAANSAAENRVVESPFARLSNFRVDAPVAYFDTDSSEIREKDLPAIRELAESVKAEQAFILTVSGHADSRGSVEHNQKLSMMRAESVAEVLRANGIDASRIKVTGMGHQYAAGSPDAYEILPLDRKTVITVSVAAPAAPMR